MMISHAFCSLKDCFTSLCNILLSQSLKLELQDCGENEQEVQLKKAAGKRSRSEGKYVLYWECRLHDSLFFSMRLELHHQEWRLEILYGKQLNFNVNYRQPYTLYFFVHQILLRMPLWQIARHTAPPQRLFLNQLIGIHRRKVSMELEP